ncbi:MAG: hypothetical protein ACRCVI_02325 [Mycoplasmoidaceae bacterium]
MNKILKMANYYNELEEKYNAYGVFSYDNEIEELLSDYVNYPQALLISFIVDDETASGEAEEAPLKMKNAFGTLDLIELSEIKFKDFINVFVDHKITSNPEKDGELIYNMISLLMSEYDLDASRIWADEPTSKELKRRLVQFKGMNAKKANLFALVLVNKFKLKLKDYSMINISDDKNIRRAMEEIKLINRSSTYEDMKYVCKILNPNFPGVFDTFFWSLGEYLFNGDEGFKYKVNDQEFVEHCINAALEVI